jgi:inhibitor of the pro-sigma K processing machinery
LSPYIIIGVIIIAIVLALIKGIPVSALRIVSQSVVKVLVGALILFFINVAGGYFGIHIPINLFTTIISGFLGIAGVASLFAIHMFLLP